MTRALIPGSFDPITLGHVDIIERCTNLFEDVIVGVANNWSKRYLFNAHERVSLAKTVTKNLANVQVARVEGLLALWCEQNGVDVIVKGLRTAGDASFELPQATVNHNLADIETLFLPTRAHLAHISSTIVKEVAVNKGSVRAMVPEPVECALRDRIDSTTTL
ncbi:pantetheine-phosphate adenylyltransferase [Gleimia hominis]|uniref:pantetheine-phosphate adenylyltransferase n=1 Tax=Gleimia hominis TaxID=595468 RepID=UPI000C80058C|nr:pantetheine-phosphate adenylyltransferase [Gleimia hominis]WIK65210.1 pantetheine-phosphate adenylyltransferase [Gleimia hominis]